MIMKLFLLYVDSFVDSLLDMSISYAYTFSFF